MNTHELAAMRRAIAISAQGLGSTSPNPPVGCVILDREGRTVGEGYHVHKGNSHAEVNALTAAGRHAAGGTALVTLEPCNHYGRTPPCREALIHANVARVLIAVMDPTSRGEGGAALLREAGVQVETNILEDEALIVLGPWLAALNRGRPFVTWVYTAGSDGLPNSNNERDVAFDEMRALRESYDLVVGDDGRIAEGSPAGHGEDFRTPVDWPSRGAVDILGALGETGARSLLVHGASEHATAFNAAGAVDQVIVYLPSTAPSWSPECGHLTAVPEGYRISDVTRRGNHVRVVGRRV
ncbi:bifunctional diaminohydroxyphosphoribosylaminopyrimidine deaminase/5-amino-6-(5-phosphoribosylamino)uracil reductase RibD [Streptomyces sp. NPDC088194]|uniref:bifunctional diaminohydroxyphosphoribosylaminopyrimidine deaminase/5-amino-6-(5-phosphoribosylamino)uracil reductase RibD n=1 Tax=Streptomyces sp. NPDC088194 TaxID=3154931 RepID=UPI00344FF82B